ncbi:MAG TPA: hypothetical protein VHP30_04190 [Ignavibacteriales bacterium]|nr:hypothetical protein [Ignavibacteriales bacterium]
MLLLNDDSNLLIIALIALLICFALDLLTKEEAKAEPLPRGGNDSAEVAMSGDLAFADSIACAEDNLLLYRIKPNPFVDSVTLRYSLGKPSDVQISVFNDRLDLIERNVYRKQAPGSHNYVFKDCELPEGSYFIKIEACGKALVERIVKLLYE